MLLLACDNRSLIVERLSTHVSLMYYSKLCAKTENSRINLTLVKP